MGHWVTYQSLFRPDKPSRSDPANKTSKEPELSQSIKKLIGTFLLVALVILYALIATTIASARLAESPWWIHMAYFFFTGILWVVPAMFIIKWMLTPKR